MNQSLRITWQCPPGGFRHRCRHCTCPLITALVWEDFLIKIRRHEEVNSHPISTISEIETQLCELLPPGHCKYEDGSTPDSHGCNVDGEQMLAGARSLLGMAGQWVAGWFTGKSVWVDQAEANRRANICARCPRNVSVGSCPTCHVVSTAKDILNGIKGEKTTDVDNFCDQCCGCGCDIKTIVWIRKDILTPHMDASRHHENCWKLSID